MKILMTLALTLSFLSCSATATPGNKLPTAEYVDVSKYIGKWYSLMALPQFFTRNCLAQTAEYEIIDTKTISVLNTCIKREGRTTTINGKAVVTNPRSNAELIVTFDNFFTRLFRVKGDYNIIALDSYQYVMIGTNDRKSLWIMSRTTDISTEVLEKYLALAADLGFDVNALERSQF